LKVSEPIFKSALKQEEGNYELGYKVSFIQLQIKDFGLIDGTAVLVAGSAS